MFFLSFSSYLTLHMYIYAVHITMYLSRFYVGHTMQYESNETLVEKKAWKKGSILESRNYCLKDRGGWLGCASTAMLPVLVVKTDICNQIVN